MINWLFLISFLPLASSTVNDCNIKIPSKQSQCNTIIIDDNTRCCYFTSGVNESGSCYGIDITSIKKMNTEIEAYKESLIDKTNFNSECGNNLQRCERVKTPYDKYPCLEIPLDFSLTCCMLKVEDTNSCYPVKAIDIPSIDEFAADYKIDHELSKIPQVICYGKRIFIKLFNLITSLALIIM